MFREIKNKEILEQIFLKLNQIEEKITSIDKALKDKVKTNKVEDTKIK